MRIKPLLRAAVTLLARHWVYCLQLALVILGVYLVGLGFKKPLLNMPLYGELFFHEDSNGGEGKARLIDRLIAAGGIAGLLGARHLAGILAGAGTAVFLASLEAIHRVGMDRLETLGQSPMFRNSADIIAKGIEIASAPWFVGSGCALVIIAGFLPGTLPWSRGREEPPLRDTSEP